MFLLSTLALCLSVFWYFYRLWNVSRLKGISTFKFDIFPIGHMFIALNKFSRNHFHTKIHEILMGCSKLLSRDGMFYLRMFHKNIVFLTSADAVKELLTSKTHLTKPDLYAPMKIIWGEGLISTSHVPTWKSHRKFVNQHLSLTKMEKYQLIMNRQSACLCRMLNELAHGSPVPLYRRIGCCTKNISIEIVTGFSPKNQLDTDDELVRMFERSEVFWTESFLNPVARLDILYFKLFIGKEYDQAATEYRSFFRNILEDRKAAIKRKSEVSHCQDAREENCSVLDSFLLEQLKNERFTDEEIVDELATLVAAGLDTSAVAVAWTLYYIGYYPEVQKKVQQELDSIFETDRDREVTTRDMNQMEYISCVHKESMRLSPPIFIFARNLSVNSEINGKNIPKGTEVAVVVSSVHRDPKYYPNPLEFRPERFFPENVEKIPPHAFIPFSFGPRNCVGSTFATKTALIMLSSILRKFEIISTQHRDQLPVKWGVVGKPEIDILFKLVPRT